MTNTNNNRTRIIERFREENKKYPPLEYPSVLQDETKPLRVAFYARVATPAPDQVVSFDLQTKMLTDRLEEHPNWTLVDEYKDEGCSGKRKELSRLIEDCKAGKIDFVLTRSLSRLSRNQDELFQIIKTLKELDPPVGIMVENENIYTLDDPIVRKLEILNEYAQEESRMKSLRGGGDYKL